MNKKKKSVNNIYDLPITFDNIFSTWKIVRRTCKNRKAVFKFSLNKNVNVYNIYMTLKNRNYKPLPFRLFLIFEPKARLVMSQTVSDKIVNHFITNYYLLPYLEKKLIDQNVATRKNKGSSYANKLIIDYINKIRIKDKNIDIYCLKIDISKYFYSIDHNLLLKMLEEDIEDKSVIDIIKKVIGETNKPYVNETINKYNREYNENIPLYKFNTGLSIGAMTSQFLAIYFLNGLDHYIKEELKCNYYIRYMDDFLIFDTSLDNLKEIWVKIEDRITDLKLKMNPKSGLYKLTGGISFLGYTYKMINSKLKVTFRKKTITKIRKKLKILKEKDQLKYYKSYASYYGYLNKIGNYERNFKMKTLDKYLYYKEKYPKHIIFIKEGTFYKTFKDDAIIIWHFFDYKWNGDAIAFGASPYSKVLDKLNQLEISYIVVSNNEEELVIDNDSENFDLYLKLATKRYTKFKEKMELTDLFNKVIEDNTSFLKVKDFLNNLIVNED